MINNFHIKFYLANLIFFKEKIRISIKKIRIYFNV